MLTSSIIFTFCQSLLFQWYLCSNVCKHTPALCCLGCQLHVYQHCICWSAVPFGWHSLPLQRTSRQPFHENHERDQNNTVQNHSPSHLSRPNHRTYPHRHWTSRVRPSQHDHAWKHACQRHGMTTRGWATGCSCARIDNSKCKVDNVIRMQKSYKLIVVLNENTKLWFTGNQLDQIEHKC